MGDRKGHAPNLTQAKVRLAEDKAGPGPTGSSPLSSLQGTAWLSSVYMDGSHKPLTVNWQIKSLNRNTELTIPPAPTAPTYQSASHIETPRQISQSPTEACFLPKPLVPHPVLASIPEQAAILKSCGGRNGSREEEMDGWDRESNTKRWAAAGGRVCHASLSNLPIHCDPRGNRWPQWRWQRLRLQRKPGLNPQSVLTNSPLTSPHHPTTPTHTLWSS